MSCNLKVRIDFKADFTIGTGYGLAGILDNTVIKTRDLVPYIPGTTIKGNIRKSCFEISRMLELPLPHDDNPAGDKDSMLARIFGTAFTEAALCFSSAYPANMHSIECFSSHFVQGESHNKIDWLTRTAEEDHLFAYEAASKMLEYSFDITGNYISDTVPTKDEIAFLIAGIIFTDRIGAKKTRGKGKCSLQVEDFDYKEVEIWVEKILKALKG